MIKKLITASILGACLLAPAQAQTTERDLEVIGRVLGFLQGPSGSDRTVAIAYGPEAQAEAQAIVEMMAGGLSTGRVTMVSQLLDGTDTSGLAGAHAVVLVGSAINDATLRQAASDQGILSVSTQTDCADAATCMLGIASSPSIRIVVNRSNLQQAGLRFDPAFVLMVEEV